jgi:hypothetical protein
LEQIGFSSKKEDSFVTYFVDIRFQSLRCLCEIFSNEDQPLRLNANH